MQRDQWTVLVARRKTRLGHAVTWQLSDDSQATTGDLYTYLCLRADMISASAAALSIVAGILSALEAQEAAISTPETSLQPHRVTTTAQLEWLVSWPASITQCSSDMHMYGIHRASNRYQNVRAFSTERCPMQLQQFFGHAWPCPR